MEPNATATTTINATVITIGEPPPFPAPPRSVDFSPLKFILAILAVITIPALLYALFFVIICPPSRRRGRNSGESPPPSTTDPVASPPPGSAVSDGARDRSEGECPICWSKLEDGRAVKPASSCGHLFHSECLDKWLASKLECPTCPTCRAPVPSRRSSGNSTSGNNTNNRAGGRRVSAHNLDEDLHQGLPDASRLV